MRGCSPKSSLAVRRGGVRARFPLLLLFSRPVPAARSSASREIGSGSASVVAQGVWVHRGRGRRFVGLPQLVIRHERRRVPKLLVQKRPAEEREQVELHGRRRPSLLLLRYSGLWLMLLLLLVLLLVEPLEVCTQVALVLARFVPPGLGNVHRRRKVGSRRPCVCVFCDKYPHKQCVCVQLKGQRTQSGWPGGPDGPASLPFLPSLPHLIPWSSLRARGPHSCRALLVAAARRRRAPVAGQTRTTPPPRETRCCWCCCCRCCCCCHRRRRLGPQ
jgi:hypothetical protein